MARPDPLSAIVAVFFAAQLALIAVAPWNPTGPLWWAPFHEHATYRIEARVAGEMLGLDQIRARYGLYGPHYDAERDLDWQTNRMSHVFDIVERVEQRAAEPAEVRVTYRVNGAPEAVWTR